MPVGTPGIVSGFIGKLAEAADIDGIKITWSKTIVGCEDGNEHEASVEYECASNPSVVRLTFRDATDLAGNVNLTVFPLP